jgi:hypothetical protein
MRISISVQQQVTASHVSLDPKVELITCGKYFNHAEKQRRRLLGTSSPE